MKTLRHSMKKLKAQINGKISCAHEWKELVVLKCPFYPKQCAHSMQFLSKFQWDFSQRLNKQSWHLCGTTKDPEQPRGSWERRTAAGGNSLTDLKPYYKATVTKQCRNGTKRSTWARGIQQRAQEKTTHMRSVNLWQSCQGYTSGKGLSPQ